MFNFGLYFFSAVICRDPGTPQNGNRRLVNQQSGQFTCGSYIEYTCNNGFQIRGNSRMDCQANGQFSGALPTCEPICNLSFLCFWNSYPFVDLQIDRSCYILFNLKMYDSLTLPDTKIKTKTDADTDKICIEPDGNFHGSLSLSSMNTSTKFCLVVCQCKHTVRPKCYWYSSCIENISEIDVARFQFDAIVCFHFQ